jgi:two-component system response regulator YesN
MKLLIVDDEEQIREGIRRFVLSRPFGLDAVETANDGQEALNKVKTFHPDIILSDVVMPVMNGIQFAKESREMLKDVKIIMISGHGDFDFVRSSLRINVYDYILKPIDLDELSSVLTSVLDRCAQEMRERAVRESEELKFNESIELLRERFFQSFLSGEQMSVHTIAERLDYLGLPVALDKPYTVLYCTLEWAVMEELALRRVDPAAALLRCMGSCLPDHAVRFVVDERVVVALVPHLPMETPGETDEHWSRLYRETVRQLGYNVTIGIGGPSIDFFDAPRAYREAETAAAQRFLRKEAGVIPFHEVADRFIEQAEAGMLSSQECLRLLQAEERDTLTLVIRRHFGDWKRIPAISLSGIHELKLELSAFVSKLVKEVNGKLDGSAYHFQWEDVMQRDSLGSIEVWMLTVFDVIGERLRNNGGKQHKRLVGLMKEAADSRYRQGLGVQQLSDQLGYSPNYLSALFKQETGVNFTEYLTRIRLVKAKELMDNPALKIYEICAMVGYEDENYFSRVFRKYFGLNPSDYRESLT